MEDTITNIETPEVPSIDTPVNNSFGSQTGNGKTKFVFIGVILLIVALIIGLIIGLYFHKSDKKCEPCICPEAFNSKIRPMKYKVSPVLNPLVGPNSQKMDKLPEGIEPVANTTFPPKFASADQPYASDNFALHN